MRADAQRLSALALSRQAKWAEAFACYHALFELEPTATNALQLATTSVMAGELLRGKAWYDRACALNSTELALPAGRLCTQFISALEEAGEHDAALPFLEWLAQAYRQTYITDDHHLWMRGLPFLGEFLRRSWALQAHIKPRWAMRRWYEELGAGLDESGRLTVTRFLAEMDDAVIRPEKG